MPVRNVSSQSGSVFGSFDPLACDRLSWAQLVAMHSCAYCTHGLNAVVFMLPGHAMHGSLPAQAQPVSMKQAQLVMCTCEEIMYTSTQTEHQVLLSAERALNSQIKKFAKAVQRSLCRQKYLMFCLRGCVHDLQERSSSLSRTEVC